MHDEVGADVECLRQLNCGCIKLHWAFRLLYPLQLGISGNRTNVVQMLLRPNDALVLRTPNAEMLRDDCLEPMRAPCADPLATRKLEQRSNVIGAAVVEKWQRITSAAPVDIVAQPKRFPDK